MSQVSFKQQMESRVRYNTFARSDYANYRSANSIVPDSAMEVLKNCTFIIDSKGLIKIIPDTEISNMLSAHPIRQQR